MTTMTPEDEEFEAIAKRQFRIQSDKEAFESAKKREWVGLTDEEIEETWKDSCTIDNGKGANLTNQPFYHLVKLAEAKLKEKNT